MPDIINVTGKVSVRVQFRNVSGLSLPAGLQKLGEGVDLTEPEHQVFMHNVPGDRNGGPEGPPIDVQYLGEIVKVRVEMSRWDAAVWDHLRKMGVKAAIGTILDAHVGALLLAGRSCRLLLDTAVRPINFPCCIIRNPYQYAMGTKWARSVIEFEAHRTPAVEGQATAQDNILFDATTTAYASDTTWA